MADCPVRRLSVSSRPGPSGFVQVVVADTGPGVTPEIADKLFTAFVSTKPDGMGLGLSICRTIIEANGGRIWMQAAEAGGPDFHFTLVREIMEHGHGSQKARAYRRRTSRPTTAAPYHASTPGLSRSAFDARGG